MKKNNIIEEELKPLDGYLISISRNTLKGWYELKIGVPIGWVYQGNEYIGCDVINETENGVLLKIYPKYEDIYIDDLLFFSKLILDTNSKIAAKEREFKDKMDKVKENLKNEAQEFYEQLENLKTDSFRKFTDNNNDDSDDETPVVKPKPRSKTTKSPRKINVKTVKDEEETKKTVPLKQKKTVENTKTENE